MIRLDLKDRLSVRNWEKALPADSRSGTAGESVVLDLSRVRWVEPHVAVRAALYVEAALLNGARVDVLLPRQGRTAKEKLIQDRASSGQATDDERKLATYVSATIEGRQSAGLVLDSLEFEQVLQQGHLAKHRDQLRLVHDYDWSTGHEDPVTAESDAAESGQPPPLDAVHYTGEDILLPLTWVGSPNRADPERDIDELARDVFAKVHVFVTDVTDANTLVHVFVRELADNIARHAGHPAGHGLLAVWRRPSYLGIKDDEFLEAEEGFISWVHALETKPAYVVEMSIGDSGRGIPAVLNDAWVKSSDRASPLITGRPTPKSNQDKQDHRNEDIMAWAFEKWSTSRTDRTGPEWGTCGLYRLRRTVQKYGGFVSVRCERSFVGLSFHGRTPAAALEDKNPFVCQRMKDQKRLRLRTSRGTFVHLRIPMLSSANLTKAYYRGVGEPEVREVPYARDEEWSIDSFLKLVREKTIGGSDRSLAVVVDLGGRRFTRPGFLQLLRALIQLSHPGLLVVVDALYETDAGRLATEPEVENILGEPQSQGVEEQDNPGDPFLFRMLSGTYKWVGLPQGASPRIYDRFLTDGRVSLEDPQTLGDKEEDPEDLRRKVVAQLRSADHAFAQVGQEGSEALSFELRHGLEFLQELATQSSRVSRDLSEVLERKANETLKKMDETFERKDDEKWAFRTPSCKEVSRFVNCRDLMEELITGPSRDDAGPPLSIDEVCEALAGSVAKANQRLETPIGGSGFQVIADIGLRAEYGDRFTGFLAGRLGLSTDKVSFDRLGPGDHPGDLHSEEIPVIILADMVHSESTVRRIISQLADAGRLPCLIAALVDAREQGDDLELNKDCRIPVVAVTPFSAGTGASGKVRHVYVDIRDLSLYEKPTDDAWPVLRVQSSDKASPKYDWRPAEDVDPDIREWILKTGAAYRGHIIQPQGRHFPWYVDINRVLRKSDEGDPRPTPQGRIILDMFKHVINTWRNGAGLDLIASVRGQDPPVGKTMGDLIAKEYCDAKVYDQRTATVVNANFRPESQSGDGKRLCRAVVVNWGSMTGSTIREVAPHLARSYENILFVVLLSQAPRADDFFLTKLRTMESDRGPSSVSVRFLKRLRVPKYDPYNCPMCLDLKELELEERTCPTTFLKKYAQSARSQVKRRQLVDFRKDSTAPSQSELDDVLKVLHLRDLADEAEKSTHKRFDLLLILEEMLGRLKSVDLDPASGNRRSEAETEARRLILLLTYEWTILHRPPFALPRFRQLVADIAVHAVVSLLKESGFDADPGRLETAAKALVVLRRASKAVFAEEFPTLFKMVCEYELLNQGATASETTTLTGSMLYSAFSVLYGPHRHRKLTKPLEESLEMSRETLEPRLLRTTQSSVSLTVAQTLAMLCDYARVQQLKQTDQTLRERDQLWADFRKEFEGLIAADGLAASKIVWGLGLAGLTHETLGKHTPEQWKRWLDLWIEVHEAIIGGRLFHWLSRYEREIASVHLPNQAVHWLGSKEDGLLKCASEFRLMLEAFSAGQPSRADTSARFQELRTLLWVHVFDPGERGSADYPNGSSLAEIVRGCPVDLRELSVPGVRLVHREDQDEGDETADFYVRYSSAEPVRLRCHTRLLQRIFAAVASAWPGGSVSVERRGEQVRMTFGGKECSSVRDALVTYEPALEAWGCEVDHENLSLHFRLWVVNS